jgi:hypothetical protein
MPKMKSKPIPFSLSLYRPKLVPGEKFIRARGVPNPHGQPQ